MVFTVALGLFLCTCKNDDDGTGNQMPPTPVDKSSLNENLEGHYPFDGNANDLSVFANHGELFGAAFGEDRNGEIARAASFDGVDDYIEIPHSSAINFGVNQEFSISFWIKYGDQVDIANDNTNNDVLSKWCDGTNCESYPWGVRVLNQTRPNNPGALVGVRYDGPNQPNIDCKNASAVDTGEDFSDNTFHHIVFQKSGTRLKFYVDGILKNEDIDETVSACGTESEVSLFVGVRQVNGFRAFKGFVDELRIYSRTLTEEEIGWLFEE